MKQIKEKSCGAVIFSEKTGKLKILLIKHVNGNHWAFPKGHIEEDETERETAAREIKEETSLEVEFIGDFRTAVEYSPKENVIKEVVYFIAEAKSTAASLQKEEVRTAKWFLPEKAYAAVTYENDKNVLKKAVEYLENNNILKR